MAFLMRNEAFRCENCGKEVPLHPSGSARNHCPHCLFSKHVDAEYPGDRASDCNGAMKPADIEIRKKNGQVLVHECVRCKKRSVNKTAEDDELLPFLRERAKRLESENLHITHDSTFL
jgi:DNA-directed RNA polymerase subunit RPC12/RpoP